jgi:S-adenosylmethionine:tRNA ribosyltransferase-isomerase
MHPFTYTLPPELIAQRPWDPPDEAKLLVVDRSSKAITIELFRELPRYLASGDLLVLNDTRVMPARLFGECEGRSVEVLLVSELGGDCWRVLGRPMKQLRRGGEIRFSDILKGRVEASDEGEARCLFFTEDGTSVRSALEAAGTMPIPPYIRAGRGDEQDRADYQTIFARNEGSIAAPTASLHFTERLLADCRERGVGIVFLTLHVGTASFLPAYRAGSHELRPPESERFFIPQETIDEVARVRRAGGRVVAVGTTVARALESAGSSQACLQGSTELFITPGYQWKMTTNLVTNFHQPGTTHLLLVEALLGRELLAEVYNRALLAPLRFLSYGDGMIVL